MERRDAPPCRERGQRAYEQARRRGDGMERLSIQELESPIGTLLLAATERGLCNIEFGSAEHRLQRLKAWAAKIFGADSITEAGSNAHLAQASGQLCEYFARKRRQFDLSLDLHGTSFQLQVWGALQEVGYGVTASYKDIAAAIGSPRAVRAVGGANNRNPVPIIVPCHRIIGASGELVGYGGGLDVKIYLLDHENGR
ncbi:methylated-DNA--[protein]-cysteine S-methyltransferase [Paenibacillus sp. y28]